MLSRSDESFLAEVDLPSLQQTAEQVLQPRCEAVADMRASFTDLGPEERNTRFALGHEMAKANDATSIVRLIALLRSEPGETLRLLGKALLADESSGRPSADGVADARSMSTCRQHMERVRAAHSSHKDIATLIAGGSSDV